MENSAFTKPQRQSEIGIALLTLINFGKLLKNFWPILVIYLFQDKTVNGLLIASAIIGASLVFFSVISYFQYLNFTYFINTKTDEFVVNKGIVTKKTITIERNKIQEININQPFIHKLFNIFQLEIDSPGSEKKEVTVNAISYKNAVQLKQYLLESKIKDEAIHPIQPDSSEGTDNPDIKISLSSLFKYGLTANYLRSFVTIIAFAFYLFQQFLEFVRGDAFSEYVSNAKNWEEAVHNPALQTFSWLGIITLIAVVFILGILANVFLNIVKYFGMKISKKEDRLSLQFGLFNTKNSIVGRRKVQMISQTQNYLQKRANILQLRFNQISDDEFHKDSYSTIPGCNKDEKEELMKFIWKTLPKFSSSLKPNIRKLIMNNLLFVFFPSAFAVLFWASIGSYNWLIVAYLIIVEILLVISYLNNRLFVNDNFIRVQSGIWDLENKTIEIHKIQAVKLSQYFWQRRTDLGSVTFFTAGGRISFRTSKYAALKKLTNFAVYKLESSGKNWM